MTTEELYIDMLNECYGSFRVGTLEFTAADILESCDPVAYYVGLSDYESVLEENNND